MRTDSGHRWHLCAKNLYEERGHDATPLCGKALPADRRCLDLGWDTSVADLEQLTALTALCQPYQRRAADQPPAACQPPHRPLS